MCTSTGIPWILLERQKGRGEVRMSWYSSIYVADTFLKIFAWGEITKGTISVSPRDGQAGQVPPGTNLWWALRCHWNNWDYGASKLRFPQPEEFIRKWSAIWACDLKSACHPCPRPKMLIKCISFKKYKITTLHGAPNYWTTWGALTSGAAVDKLVSESQFRLKCIWQIPTPQKQMQPRILTRFYMDTHHGTVFWTLC